MRDSRNVFSLRISRIWAHYVGSLLVNRLACCGDLCVQAVQPCLSLPDQGFEFGDVSGVARGYDAWQANENRNGCGERGDAMGTSHVRNSWDAMIVCVCDAPARASNINRAGSITNTEGGFELMRRIRRKE